MVTSNGECADSIQVRVLFEALGIDENDGGDLTPPGKPGDFISYDAAVRWLDAVAEAGGACGVRARFLRVRLILGAVG
jgi:hypothetical protein